MYLCRYIAYAMHNKSNNIIYIIISNDGQVSIFFSNRLGYVRLGLTSSYFNTQTNKIRI